MRIFYVPQFDISCLHIASGVHGAASRMLDSPSRVVFIFACYVSFLVSRFPKPIDLTVLARVDAIPGCSSITLHVSLL